MSIFRCTKLPFGKLTNISLKKEIMINEGKIEKGNGRRTSKIDAVLDLISFDTFVVLLVLVNIKKEPGGSKSSRYVFYPHEIALKTTIKQSDKLASKETAGTDELTNERVGKQTNERPLDSPTDRPAEQTVQHAYDVKFDPGDCTMFFPYFLSSVVNCFHFLLFSCAVPVRPKLRARLLCKRSQLVNQVQAHLPQSHRAPVPQVASRPGQVQLTHQAGPHPLTSKKK